MGSSCKKTLSENFICITLSSPRLSPLTVPLCFRQYSFLSVPSSLFFLPLIAFFFPSLIVSLSLSLLFSAVYSLSGSVPPLPVLYFHHAVHLSGYFVRIPLMERRGEKRVGLGSGIVFLWILVRCLQIKEESEMFRDPLLTYFNVYMNNDLCLICSFNWKTWIILKTLNPWG